MFQKIFQIIIQNIYRVLFSELQRKSSFSASYNLWKGVIETVNKKIFQIIIQNIYRVLFSELQRKSIINQNTMQLCNLLVNPDT